MPEAKIPEETLENNQSNFHSDPTFHSWFLCPLPPYTYRMSLQPPPPARSSQHQASFL